MMSVAPLEQGSPGAYLHKRFITIFCARKDSCISQGSTVGVHRSMASFYDYAVPMFLLVFLIICLMAFLWVKQQQDNIQAPIKHKPVYSKPFRPEMFTDLYKEKEGFQTSAPTVVSGAPQAVLKGSGSGSGSRSSSLWPSQFDLSEREQALYGNWEKTPFDTYYDDYELAESDAAGNQLLKFNDIEPAPSAPPDFGSSLGAFDSETTRIPWDKDNESYQQTDVVWGYVSEQASRSIFLKTYVNELAANANSFIPCSEDNPTNYCYKSPLFDVSVTDQKLAYVTKTGEAVAQAVGMLPMMYLSEVDMNLSNLSEVYEKRKLAISNFLDSMKSTKSHQLGKVQTITTEVGNSLALGVGPRKTLAHIKNVSDKISASAKAVLDTTRIKAQTVALGVTLSVTGATALTAAAALTPAAPVAAPMAAVLAKVSIGVDLFFGVFGGICMAIEAILEPMAAALYNTGGECPDNYKPITELVPTPVLTALSASIPLAPFLQMFDPYICWRGEKGLGDARLRIPPKVPPFMSDRTLSLVYHAAWQTGHNPAIPSPTSLSFMLDPLPPGYVWLEQSDLANKPNVNELAKYATDMAMLAQGSRGLPSTNSAQGGSGTLPSNIAVKTCEQNTVPSLDGRRCNKKEIKFDPVLPSLSQCDSGTTDDGYNCWDVNLGSSSSCKGGEISYTTTNTWNDATGYFQVTSRPVVCNGITQTTNTNIRKGYIQRITCPANYENTSPELLCYRRCQPGFIRNGAICSGATQSYDRQYMFGTSTMYKTQRFDPQKLNDISDVTIPYCDFSKPYMLNKMAEFYYKNSLQNPSIKEDGTIQIQMITKFFGVIASSELSCDVVCSIEFISYDPITGGNYSSYTGCSYLEDEEYKYCNFCFRRFYFIRRGDETNLDEFTVTGCTWTDYTAPDAMVKSSDTGTNPVQSLPKNLKIHRKDASIINYARFNNEWKSGAIMRRASAGLLIAGITIAGGMLGGPAGKGVKWAAGTGVKIAAKNLVEEGAKGGAKISIDAAADTASSISRVLKEGGDDAAEQALNVARASNITGKQAQDLIETLQKNIKSSDLLEQRSAMGFGLVGGVGAGLFTSMYLDAELQKTAAARLPPEDVNGAANTFITGKDMYNLQVATNNNWWTINHGAIYELAEGHIPTINFCEGVKIPYSYCTYKYAVRDMVHKYHNENERRHIKEILAIEPRGDNGCYYKWNEVVYDPNTNIEETVLIEKEIILSHVIKDYSTCTFKPTDFFQDVNDPIYKVRSYIEPSTNRLENPRIIYPTRNTVYTSDLFARYVRVRRPESAATRGSGDGVLNLAQISVFDVSGFNVSVQMPVYATSDADGAATPDTVVNGTSDQTDTLSTVWQPRPATSDTNPYWEVDLEKLVNISQVVYFGGTFDAAKFRNKGVRIEFLYTKGANDAPIYTYTLPSDDSIQIVTMYSSSYTVPNFPIAGPIKIPRPIAPGKVLGVESGCVNRCEDKGIIDSLVQQYNNIQPSAGASTGGGSTIIKVLRAITANSTTCEYEAEVVKTDVNAGSSTIAKNSITKQILSMQVSHSTTKGYGGVFARYIKISPNNVPGTLLEFSKIIVRNTVRPGSSNYGNNQRNIVSDGKNISEFNTFYELKEIYCTRATATSVCKFDTTKMRFLMEPPNQYNPENYTMIDPALYPKVWKARSNQEGTCFILDLVPPGTGSLQNGNYEIYDIVIIGTADRRPGGLRGVKIELFPDRPGDQDNATKSGVATPIYTYYLQSDDVKQRILVEPPSKCDFTLTQTDVLKFPTFLQEKSGDLSAEDTSGGVFSFSTVLDSVKSAWNTLLPTSSKDMVAPIQNNLKKSNEIVHQMLETISANKTILNSTKKCSDPDILKTMMTAYNIKKGAPVTGEFSVIKNTMLRILKAGQSTPSTCDVLFENLEEYYDDYIQDITNKTDIKKSVKAARFKFTTTNRPNVPVAPDMNSITYDIDSNALGIMSDNSVISPVYAGPSCKVDCGNPVQIDAIAKFRNSVNVSTTKIVRSAYTRVLETFQGSPLSCEYKMLKSVITTNKVTNKTVISDPVYTYLKAIFTLDTDGCTQLLSSVKEYDTEKITHSNDYSKSFLDGIEVTLPNLYWYEPSKLVSTRVDSTVKNIS